MRYLTWTRIVGAQPCARKAVCGAAALFLGAGLPARAGDINAVVRDAGGNPVPEAIVFIYEVPGAKFEAPKNPAFMDQINKDFVPHVLPVLVGTPVKFPNKDNTHHHIYSFSKIKKFEVPLYKGKSADPVVMDKPGTIKLGCNIHDWMLGYIMVLDNPYFAMTGAEGMAAIKGVPKGEYQVAVWSERLKGPVDATLQKVKVGTKPTPVEFKPDLAAPKKPRRPAVSDY